MALTKLQRLSALLDEFDSPDDAARLLHDLRIQKLRDTHAAAAAPHGSVAVNNWAGLEAYLNEPVDRWQPAPQLLARLQAELKVAVSARDQTTIFSLLVVIAKLTKPRNLYGQ